MPPAAKPVVQRKRTRKRKRRAASSSSSSSSSSSDSSEDEQPVPSTKSTKVEPVVAESESTSSDSDSSESSSSSSEEEKGLPAVGKKGKTMQQNIPRPTRHISRSPSPPPTALPSFLPTDTSSQAFKTQEQDMKERFRQFWMASVADGFKNDLEQIRKEPNLGTSRLALLIDSLASGADVFTSSQANGEADEMDMLLG